MMAVALTATMDSENESHTPGKEEGKLTERTLISSHVSIYGPSMGPPSSLVVKPPCFQHRDSGSILGSELRSRMPPGHSQKINLKGLSIRIKLCLD